MESEEINLGEVKIKVKREKFFLHDEATEIIISNGNERIEVYATCTCGSLGCGPYLIVKKYNITPDGYVITDEWCPCQCHTNTSNNLPCGSCTCYFGRVVTKP